MGRAHSITRIKINIKCKRYPKKNELARQRRHIKVMGRAHSITIIKINIKCKRYPKKNGLALQGRHIKGMGGAHSITINEMRIEINIKYKNTYKIMGSSAGAAYKRNG